MRELFVYYRIRTNDAAAAHVQVLGMQRSLRDDIAGLEARLLTRVDAAGGAETWMETYALAEGGIDERVQSLIAARAEALVPFIDGPRQVETFAAVAAMPD